MSEQPRANKRLKKGDKVIAIAGNERGQSGQVLRIIGDKAIVQGMNIRKKHVKKSQANPRGAIIDLEKPIHLSNLRVCTEENTPVKLRVRFSKKGQRELFYKIDGQEVLHRSVKKQNT